ncbi:MAG TPA: SDR family NAD(P)-dependent oxidoreductase, partial [Nocardioides sp.]|nr:SDR family NAD(P)-dependent oxidoreductase [Nocardioides sp.]
MRAPVRHLSGRNVFVTGAASGIGRAVAVQAAREGAVLHLTDLRAEPLAAAVDEIRAAGGQVALAETADVADRDAVRRLAARVADVSGAMDVVLNVAGIAAWGT